MSYILKCAFLVLVVTLARDEKGDPASFSGGIFWNESSGGWIRPQGGGRGEGESQRSARWRQQNRGGGKSSPPKGLTYEDLPLPAGLRHLVGTPHLAQAHAPQDENDDAGPAPVLSGGLVLVPVSVASTKSREEKEPAMWSFLFAQTRRWTTKHMGDGGGCSRQAFLAGKQRRRRRRRHFSEA